MQYLFLKKFESEQNMNMKCGTGFPLKKDAEVVETKMNYFQNLRIKKSKRYRSAFTTEQINYLEQEFKKFPYIGNTNRKEVANVLDISERAVKIWFQNRRMKEKREVNGNKESLLEDKNNTYNTLSKELLNNRSMKSNNYFSNDESLLSNQKEKSKESTIENPNLSFSSNEKTALTNEIKVKSFKNNKTSNTKHRRIVDFTKDNINSNIVKSINQPKIKSEITNLQTGLKLIHKNTHFNLNKDFTFKERIQNTIPCHNKKESDVAQDLTMSNTDKKECQQYYPVHSNIDQSFMPFYTQGYYTPQQATSTFQSGNIIWKPVNVMPMAISGLSACSPLPITNNCSGMSSSNRILSKGSCNCHGPPRIFNTRSQCVATTQPQYILAFPVGNSSNKL